MTLKKRNSGKVVKGGRKGSSSSSLNKRNYKGKKVKGGDPMDVVGEDTHTATESSTKHTKKDSPITHTATEHTPPPKTYLNRTTDILHGVIAYSPVILIVSVFMGTVLDNTVYRGIAYLSIITMVILAYNFLWIGIGTEPHKLSETGNITLHSDRVDDPLRGFFKNRGYSSFIWGYTIMYLTMPSILANNTNFVLFGVLLTFSIIDMYIRSFTYVDGNEDDEDEEEDVGEEGEMYDFFEADDTSSVSSDDSDGSKDFNKSNEITSSFVYRAIKNLFGGGLVGLFVSMTLYYINGTRDWLIFKGNGGRGSSGCVGDSCNLPSQQKYKCSVYKNGKVIQQYGK